MMQQTVKPANPRDDRGAARAGAGSRSASIRSWPRPELKPVLRTVGPLKINNQPVKILYETVGKVAGVNVLFDSQYNPTTISTWN